MPFARMFRVNGTPHNSSIMFNGTLHPFKHNAVIMRHCKSPASHRRRAQSKAPSVFVIRFAVMVFAGGHADPWTDGLPRPAITTPAIGSSCAWGSIHGIQSEQSRSNDTLAKFSVCQDSALINFSARPPGRSALRRVTRISSPPSAPTYWPTFIFLPPGPSGAPLARFVTLLWSALPLSPIVLPASGSSR